MARLPTAEEIGALPSALSNRPIAKYDTSGYARGAAAIAEGLGVLGRGIGRAANGFEEMRRREERNRLDRAKADAGYLVAAKNIRSALAQESDLDAVVQTYPQAFRDAYASAADTIGDPEAREEWGLARSADRDGQIAAATDHAEALRRGQEVEGVKAQLDELRTTALDSDDEETRFELMQAGQKLMFGLRDNGLIDDAGAKAMREGWATTYARERLGRMAPDERIRTLEQGEGGIAEFVPEEVRIDLLRTARVELAEAQRKAASDAALTRYVTDRDITDDIAGIEATGRGNDALTPRRVDDTLGPEARRSWQARRDDARTIWTQTHDFSTLTDAEIAARVEAAMPANDADPRQRAIFEAVGRRAAAIRNLRQHDPAASVADDPNVRVAAEELDPQNPETMQRLIETRLAAQKRAGIETPAIVTRAEGDELLRQLVDAAKASAMTPGGKPELMEQAQEQVLRRIEQTFGSHAGAVIHQLAGSLGVTGADEAASAEGNPDDSAAAQLFVRTQFRVGRAWGPSPPPLLTPQQQRDFWNDLRDASNGLLSTVDRNANYAWAMGQIVARIARDAVFNNKPGDENKPGPIDPPGWPNNTDDPGLLADRSQQPSAPPPPPPEKRPPDGERFASAIVGAGVAAQQEHSERGSVGLSSKERDALFADPQEQRRVARATVKKDFEWAMKRVEDQARKHKVSQYSAVGIWYYTQDYAYIRLNSDFAAGRATPDQRKLVSLIERGIESLPVNTQTIYRAPVRTGNEGNKIFDGAIVGEDLATPNHLQSYTLLSWRAASWARESDVLLRIKAPTKGALLQPFSAHPSVQEILLPTALRYRVLSKADRLVEDGKTFRIIDLELLHD